MRLRWEGAFLIWGKMEGMANERLMEMLQETIKEEIANLLEWGSQVQSPTLTDLEDRALAVRQRLGQALMQVLLEQQEQRRNAEIPVSAETGKRLHPKGSKKGRS